MSFIYIKFGSAPLISNSMTTYKEVEDHFIDKYRDLFNLLILTATEVEKEVLHENLKPLPGQTMILEIKKKKYTYYVGVFGAFYTVHVSCNEQGSMGRSSSAITAVDGIETWAPTVVLMVGIAFGANKKKKIGDVLVSEQILPYDPKRVGKKETIPRGKPGPASTLLIDRFKSVTGWDFELETGIPEIIPGLILSGETLLDNTPLKKQMLKEHPEAIGGEMEGPGIYAACDGRVDHWILVKGICDWADGNKKKDKDENQKIAIHSAVALCRLVFSKELSFKDASLVVQEQEVNTDFTEEKGGIPEWMRNKEKILAKEIRHEDR